MSEYRVATRYAKALFQLAEELNQTDAVRQDLADIGALIEKSADFAAFLHHGNLTAEEQRGVLQSLFSQKASQPVNRILELLVERRRLAILKDLCVAFEDQYRDSRGVLRARLISAFPLRPEQVDTLRGKLEKKYAKQIDVTTETDPALLGGFVVIVKDDVYDLSVQGKLAALRAELAHV